MRRRRVKPCFGERLGPRAEVQDDRLRPRKAERRQACALALVLELPDRVVIGDRRRRMSQPKRDCTKGASGDLAHDLRAGERDAPGDLVEILDFDRAVLGRVVEEVLFLQELADE